MAVVNDNIRMYKKCNIKKENLSTTIKSDILLDFITYMLYNKGA